MFETVNFINQLGIFSKNQTELLSKMIACYLCHSKPKTTDQVIAIVLQCGIQFAIEIDLNKSICIGSVNSPKNISSMYRLLKIDIRIKNIF